MLDRYVDGPDESFCNRRYGVLNKFCFAEFLRFYYVVPSANENDWQPAGIKRRAAGSKLTSNRLSNSDITHVF